MLLGSTTGTLEGFALPNVRIGEDATTYFWCMSASAKLVLIRLLHTVIWVLLSAVIFYLLYAVMADRIDSWFWWGLGLVGLEIATLLLFRLSCPLTVIARRYSDSQRANFDIFLPEWLARHNKTIYSVIMVAVLAGLVWRLVG